MNFAIFDEDFATDKANYLKEIEALEKNLIEEEYKDAWKTFVKEHLIDTRSFFLLKTSLNVIKNLKNNLDFDTAVFSSLSFMPDKTFVETTIMLVIRFSDLGEGLATHFNVDVSSILQAKEDAKKEIAKQENEEKSKKTSKPKKKEVTFGKVILEEKLISSKSERLVPVDKHLENISTKRHKK